jgi:Tfp pilus assembly protein PilZ
MGQTTPPSDPNLTERRTTPRIGVEFWAEERCGADVYFHRVTNLSRDGFFIEKKLPFQVGQTVHIRLDLPGLKSKLDAQSRVVNNYHDGYANLRGAGFQFMDMDAQARKGIEAYIDQKHSQE